MKLPLGNALGFVMLFVVFALALSAGAAVSAAVGMRLEARFKRLTIERIMWMTLPITFAVFALAFAMEAQILPAVGVLRPVRTAAGILLISAVAYVLFALKTNNGRVYAWLEIAFGLMVAGLTVDSLCDEIDGLQASALGAAAYLLIRGMDNYKKDLDERKAEALAGEAAGVN